MAFLRVALVTALLSVWPVGAAHRPLGRGEAPPTTSPLTESLVFQKKGETTKNRRKEQIAHFQN